MDLATGLFRSVRYVDLILITKITIIISKFNFATHKICININIIINIYHIGYNTTTNKTTDRYYHTRPTNFPQIHTYTYEIMLY